MPDKISLAMLNAVRFKALPAVSIRPDFDDCHGGLIWVYDEADNERMKILPQRDATGQALGSDEASV
jgi:hypothetical protein